MKLARSSFYYRPRDKDARKKADADLRDQIETICLGFPRYGYRRVTASLKREGKRINHQKVLRLMRESDLLCRVKRRRVKTTDSRHRFPRYPNLVKGITVRRLNQVWLADITYIRIRTGFVYLAAILDAFSRKVIGYAVSTALDTALTLQALKMAIADRKPASSFDVIRRTAGRMFKVPTVGLPNVAPPEGLERVRFTVLVLTAAGWVLMGIVNGLLISPELNVSVPLVTV